MSRKIWFATFAVALIAPGWDTAKQKGAPAGEPHAVHVGVVVSGKDGSYIRDLSAKDFRVWEDDRERPVQNVSFGGALGSEIRSTVLFFDESSMDVHDRDTAWQAASGFIHSETDPNHRMAVATYNGSLRVLETFTDNPQRLNEALPWPASSSGESNKKREAGGPVSAAVDFGTRDLMSAVASMAESLSAVPGRRIILLFAGRIARGSEKRSAMLKSIEACNRSGVAVYPVELRNGDKTYSNTGPDTKVIVSSAGKEGKSSGQNEGSEGQQLLLGLAEGTGAFFIRPDNLLGGFRAIVDDQNESYILSYDSADSKEGNCHAVRVKVDRSTAKVRLPASYCNSQSAEVVTSASVEKDLEKRAAANQTGNWSASVELPYFYVTANRARVHVAVDIISSLQGSQSATAKTPAPIGVLGNVASADGQVRVRFSGQQFDIGPGRYTVTVFFGEEGGKFGKVQAPLAVGAWNGEELALSSLVLSNQARPAGELALRMLMEGSTPLIAEGTQMFPSGSHEFTSTGLARVYLEVYGKDAGSALLRMRILDSHTGQSKWDSGLRKLPGDNSGKAAIAAASELPLRSLAAGSYDVEVTASDGAGNEVKRSAVFELR